MEPQSYDIDSTTSGYTKASLIDHSTRYDPNETPTVNSTNPNYQPTSTTNNGNHSWEKNHSTIETAAEKTKGELKKGQQHAEDIITKSKRLLTRQCKLTNNQTKRHIHSLNDFLFFEFSYDNLFLISDIPMAKPRMIITDVP